MKPNIVVLTDFSPAAEQARTYAAALAAPLGAELHLIHVFFPPTPTTRVGMVLRATNERYVRETRHNLEQVAAQLPVPATAELIETNWDEAVQQALEKYNPLLLVAGLTATDGPFDEWLSNRTLPLARQTGYPLLLVPEHLSAETLCPPRRLALAVEDWPFTLAPNATAIAPLLDALGTTVITVSVLPAAEWAGAAKALRATQQCGLSAAMPRGELHKVFSEVPAAGIQQAVTEVGADMLALLDPGHDWVHRLFEGSVIEQVLRQTRVPVLLLSAQVAAPED